MDEIVSKVTKIISEQLGKDESEINLESHFIDDLDADSLDTVELVMALEEEFGIDIPDDASEKITTVQSAVDFIRSATGRSPLPPLLSHSHERSSSNRRDRSWLRQSTWK